MGVRLELTKHQVAYVRRVVATWENRDTDTVRDLCSVFGTTSTHAAVCTMNLIQAKGYVEQDSSGHWRPTMRALEAYGTVWKPAKGWV